MTVSRSLGRWTLCALICVGILTVQAVPQAAQKEEPVVSVEPEECMEAVADTRLLMDGIADVNFKGLERILAQQPKSDEAWKFARGQSLLIAEMGNLLLLRPPHKGGRDVWTLRSVHLRDHAAYLASHLEKRDYNRSREALKLLAKTCNQCHTSFRVAKQFHPFQQPGKVID